MNVDTQGLTPEQIDAIIKERDEAKTAAEKAKNDIRGVVEQLTEEKRKRQELESTNEELKRAQLPPDDIQRKIDEALRSRDESARVAMQKTVVERFLSENREFANDNDPAGILRVKFQEKLKRFNLSDSSSEDDLRGVLGDALKLIKNDGSRKEDSGSYTPDGMSGSSAPIGRAPGLSAEEKSSIDRLGWTTEKYLSMKTKYPELVQSLFNN